MKCTRVLRRVTSGAFKYCSANSRARLSSLPVWHYLSDNSPLVRGSSRNRLWVQQKCLSSSCSGAIAPGREDSVARHDPAGDRAMSQVTFGIFCKKIGVFC